MSYRTPDALLGEAEREGWRKAFIVTALGLELGAVVSHMKRLAAVRAQDGSIFECGLFDDQGYTWLIVSTETGPGTHEAQSIVGFGHRALGPFELQMFVGIGGSRKADASVGAVVASSAVYMPYGGKYSSEGFTSRPASFPVDHGLVAIAKKVAFERVWPQRILDPLGETLPAPAAYPVTYPPKALVQKICSIEAVLDNPTSELEAHIARNYGDSYVVEMEGYGALKAAEPEGVPAIVIRGVSDMTQAKSATADALNQPIAAAHAAAFAFEMLSHWGQIHPKPGQQPPTSNTAMTLEASSGTDPTFSTDVITQSLPDSVLVAPSLPAPPEQAASQTTLAATTTIPVPKTDPNLVLNIAGSIEEAPSDWQERLQGLLREIGKSEAIVVVRVESGSIRAFVADPDRGLERAGTRVIRESLADRLDAKLIGIAPAAVAYDLDNITATLRAASSELLAWPRTLPDGQTIDRPELHTLRTRIAAEPSSATVLLGDAGAGKSALLADAAHSYIEAGWPVLAIKADALDPEVATEEQLRDALDLPSLPSEILQSISSFRPVLLIIDQLDALASTLDIKTARLSVLLNLVRRVGRLDNVHVLLSARSFEFHHDARLRAINADQLTLALPPLSSVVALLEADGVKAVGWPLHAQEVMRSPQALSIYLGLADRKESVAFDNYQQVLEKLWQERVIGSGAWPIRIGLVTSIARYMAEEESLWLAAARFDDQPSDLQALQAAGILVARGTSVGFRHQTLFEFALARSFAREPGQLSQLVLERQNSLFLRPKLWASLTYLRGADVGAYHKELETIWATPDLRSHLRLLLIDFIGQQRDPTDREVLLMEQALKRPGERRRGLRAMAGSPGWFRRFSHTHIRMAMNADDDSADRMIEILSRAWPFAADEVGKLIADLWIRDPSNDNRVWAILHGAQRWTEAAVGFATKIIARNDVAPGRVDWIVGMIGVDQPNFALQLVRADLDRALAKAVAGAEEKAKLTPPPEDKPGDRIGWHMLNRPSGPIEKLFDHSVDWDSLPALAEQDPVQLLASLWPWFLGLLEQLRRFDDRFERSSGYALLISADFRFEDENNHGLPEGPLLGAIRNAVELLAQHQPEIFRAWLANQAGSDLAPVHRLIAHALTTQPERYAADALEYLVADARRFTLGTVFHLRSTTLRLIAAVSPYWDDVQVARFEQAVATFDFALGPETATAEDRRLRRTNNRRAKLEVLRALPKHKRSETADRRVREEERVFGRPADAFDDGDGILIDSALTAANMAKTTDDVIVRAFEILPDATGWDHPRNFMTGGNIQLSREFATFAATAPARARAIVARLTPENGTRAAGYALDAMGEKSEPADVFALLSDIVGRDFDGEEFRGSVARGIEKLVGRDVVIPDSVFDVLEQWLTQPPTAEPSEEAAEVDDSADQTAERDDFEGLVFGHGRLSIVPHGDYPVLETLVRARLERKESDRLIESLNRYLDRPQQNRGPWEHLLRFFPYIRPERSGALAAFLRKLFDRVPSLVGTQGAAHYLANLHWTDPEVVDEQLDAWRDAYLVPTKVAYGEIVAIVALVRPDLDWATTRLDRLMAGDTTEPARVGVAHAAANLWGDDKARAGANAVLIRLIESGPPQIWNAVFDLFRMNDPLPQDEETATLLTAIADRVSGAPRLDPGFIVDRLAAMLPHEAPLVGRLARQLIDHWRTDLCDIRTGTAMAAADLVNVAVTLHRLGPETRDLGTSLFEQLLEMESDAALETLAEIDSRFRETIAGPRRRLARRSQASGPRRTRRRVLRPAT